MKLNDTLFDGIKFDGILFDLDGTLIDSLQAVDRAWRGWAAEYQLDPELVLSVIHGRPARESIAELLPHADAVQIEQAFHWIERYESQDTEGTIALPGAIALLERLNQLQIPWAVVTSGTQPVAQARLQAAGLPKPQLLITPEQLTQGKPAPEPYLTAAAQLGLQPQQCLVFEDAPAGVTAGYAAGMRVFAITTHFMPEQLPEADHYIASLTEIAINTGPDGFELALI